MDVQFLFAIIVYTCDAKCHHTQPIMLYTSRTCSFRSKYNDIVIRDYEWHYNRVAFTNARKVRRANCLKYDTLRSYKNPFFSQ